MKTLKIIVCLTIVIAAIVYAKKVPTDFSSDLAGFLKTKSATASFVNTNGWVIFKGLDAKSQIQLTKADNNANILVNDAKMIKVKGKFTGSLGSVIVGTSASDMKTPTDVVYAGNSKFSIKLKGISVGTIIAKDMKAAFANDLSSAFAGSNAKGISLMTELDIAGASATNRAVIGIAGVPTVLKAVKSKKGKIENVDATLATPAKVGKTKWKAKVAGSGNVTVAKLDDWAAAKKNKNVILAIATTNTVSGL